MTKTSTGYEPYDNDDDYDEYKHQLECRRIAARQAERIAWSQAYKNRLAAAQAGQDASDAKSRFYVMRHDGAK